MWVQANNAYIFPAVGLAAMLIKANHISDDAFLTAAKHLSEMTQIPVSRTHPFLLSLRCAGKHRNRYSQTEHRLLIVHW